MSEKVVIGNAELWHGDCREVLPLLTGVDAMITDPPYGQAVLLHHGRTGSRIEERYKGLQGDENQDIGCEVLLWAEIHGLPTLAFSSAMKPWPGAWKQHLVWDKGPALGGGGDFLRTWKHCFEIIQTARLKPLRGSRDSSVLTFWDSPGSHRQHMTQKPEALMSYLVAQTTDPGDIVFDPFLGSGTTAVSAVKSGRRAVGVEINRQYFDIACERIEQAQAQGRLFADEPAPAPEQQALGL